MEKKIEASTQSSRISLIGDEYLGYCSAQGDGLLHRTSGVNRLFYAADCTAAIELLTILSTSGSAVMKVKAETNSTFSELWSEMSRLGFFYDASLSSSLSIAWRVDEQSDSINAQVRNIAAYCAIMGFQSPLIHLLVKNANLIDPYCREISTALCTVGAARENNLDVLPIVPRLRVFSSLIDGESAIKELIDGLDSGQMDLTFEWSVTEEPANPALKQLEAEGFLPSFRATINPDMLSDPQNRSMISRNIERCLAAQQNREISVRFERPRTFGSQAVMDQYFDTVDAFVELVLTMDADLSRLSIVERPLLCLLQSKNVDQCLEARINEGALDFYHYYDGDFVGSVSATGECLDEFYGRLLYLLQEQNYKDSGNDAYQRLRPRSLAANVLCGSQMENAERIAVDKRRCRNWDRIFDWLLNELLMVSRENVEFGRPLRLDITQDRQAIYSPLYPRS